MWQRAAMGTCFGAFGFYALAQHKGRHFLLELNDECMLQSTTVAGRFRTPGRHAIEAVEHGPSDLEHSSQRIWDNQTLAGGYEIAGWRKEIWCTATCLLKGWTMFVGMGIVEISRTCWKPSMKFLLRSGSINQGPMSSPVHLWLYLARGIRNG